MTPAERYIAIYTRISKNKSGQLEKTDRQERRGRAYADQMIANGTWPPLPIRVFTDDDLSAFDPDIHRPGYEALREAIRNGEVAYLWAIEQTRLEADKRRWMEFELEMDEAGLTELHTNRDGIVRLDEVADIKAVLSWHERRRLRQRTNDTLRDLAAEGRPPGGNAFGYRHVVKDGKKALEVVPRQAEEARWAAQAIIAGWSLTAVARDLAERRVPTARGGRWDATKVRRMLTSPMIAGHRVYRGEVVGDGNWEPILDDHTWQLVRATLDTRREVTTADGRKRVVGTRRRNTARRWLLTGGIAVCGREGCGAQLAAQSRKNAYDAYLCLGGHYGGCNKLTIHAKELEDHVRDELIAYLLARQAFGSALADDEHEARRKELTDALAQVGQRRIKLSTRWSRGDLDDDEWDAARADLEAQRADLRAQLAAVPAASVAAVDPETLSEGWQEMTLDERRMVVAEHVESVTVLPGTRRGGPFDSHRVKIRFVGQV